MLKRHLAKANIKAHEDSFSLSSVKYFRSCGQYELERTMSLYLTAEQAKSFQGNRS